MTLTSVTARSTWFAGRAPPGTAGSSEVASLGADALAPSWRVGVEKSRLVGRLFMSVLDQFGEQFDPLIEGVTTNGCVRKGVPGGGASRTTLYATPSCSPPRPPAVMWLVRSGHFNRRVAGAPFTGDPIVIVDPLDPQNNVGRSCFGVLAVQHHFANALAIVQAAMRPYHETKRRRGTATRAVAVRASPHQPLAAPFGGGPVRPARADHPSSAGLVSAAGRGEEVPDDGGSLLGRVFSTYHHNHVVNLARHLYLPPGNPHRRARAAPGPPRRAAVTSSGARPEFHGQQSVRAGSPEPVLGRAVRADLRALGPTAGGGVAPDLRLPGAAIAQSPHSLATRASGGAPPAAPRPTAALTAREVVAAAEHETLLAWAHRAVHVLQSFAHAGAWVATSRRTNCGQVASETRTRRDAAAPKHRLAAGSSGVHDLKPAPSGGVNGAAGGAPRPTSVEAAKSARCVGCVMAAEVSVVPAGDTTRTGKKHASRSCSCPRPPAYDACIPGPTGGGHPNDLDMPMHHPHCAVQALLSSFPRRPHTRSDGGCEGCRQTPTEACSCGSSSLAALPGPPVVAATQARTTVVVHPANAANAPGPVHQRQL